MKRNHDLFRSATEELLGLRLNPDISWFQKRMLCLGDHFVSERKAIQYQNVIKEEAYSVTDWRIDSAVSL
jgi:hypothetical protein